MVLIRYGADSCPQFLTPKSRRAGLKFTKCDDFPALAGCCEAAEGSCVALFKS